MVIFSKNLIFQKKKVGFAKNTYVVVYIDSAYGPWGASSGNSNYNNRHRLFVCFSEDLINWERYNIMPTDDWTVNTLHTPVLGYYDGYILLALPGHYGTGGTYVSRMYYFKKEDIVNGGTLDTLSFIDNCYNPRVVNGNLVSALLKGSGTLLTPSYKYIPAGSPLSASNFITVSVSNYMAKTFQSMTYGNGYYFFTGTKQSSGSVQPVYAYATNINATDVVTQNMSQSSTGISTCFSNGRFYGIGSAYCFTGTHPGSMTQFSSHSDPILGAILYGNGYYFSYTTTDYPSTYMAWYSTNGTSFTGIARSSNWISSNPQSMIFDGEKFVIGTSFYGQMTVFSQRTPVEAATTLWTPAKETYSVYGGNSGTHYGAIMFIPKETTYIEGFGGA